MYLLTAALLNCRCINNADARRNTYQTLYWPSRVANASVKTDSVALCQYIVETRCSGYKRCIGIVLMNWLMNLFMHRSRQMNPDPALSYLSSLIMTSLILCLGDEKPFICGGRQDGVESDQCWNYNGSEVVFSGWWVCCYIASYRAGLK